MYDIIKLAIAAALCLITQYLRMTTAKCLKDSVTIYDECDGDYHSSAFAVAAYSHDVFSLAKKYGVFSGSGTPCDIPAIL